MTYSSLYIHVFMHFIITNCVIFPDTGLHASEIALSVERTQTKMTTRMTKSVTEKTRPPTNNQRPPTANIRPPTDNIRPSTSISIINSVKLPGWPIEIRDTWVYRITKMTQTTLTLVYLNSTESC